VSVFVSVLTPSLFCVSAESASDSVRELRVLADSAVAQGNIDQAISLYGRVLAVEPTPRHYFNRANAYLRRRDYSHALKDLDAALATDPEFFKGLLHRANIHKLRGACDVALKDYEKAAKLRPDSARVQKELPIVRECAVNIEQAEKLVKQSQFAKAKELYDSILEVVTSSQALMMKRARCAEKVGDYAQLVADTGAVLRSDDSNIEALAMRGIAMYKMGGLEELETAISHFRTGLRLDPEHKVLKKHYKTFRKLLKMTRNAKKAAEQKNHAEAEEWYESAVKVDPSHSGIQAQLHMELCRARVALEKADEAIESCTLVISIDDTQIDAWTLRSQAHTLKEDHEACVRDMKEAVERNKQDGNLRRMLKEAEVRLKRSKEKDWYKVLGVSNRATLKEIKRAYKKAALKNHPDKCSVDQQEECEKRFHDIGSAYEILSDDEKRGRYDRGEEIEPQPGQRRGPGPQFFHGGGGGGRTFHFNF
jgi:DnaJ homolog subfamily C member 3